MNAKDTKLEESGPALPARGGSSRRAPVAPMTPSNSMQRLKDWTAGIARTEARVEGTCASETSSKLRQGYSTKGKQQHKRRGTAPVSLVAIELTWTHTHLHQPPLLLFLATWVQRQHCLIHCLYQGLMLTSRIAALSFSLAVGCCVAVIAARRNAGH